MRKIGTIALLALLLGASVAEPALAGPLEDGVAAYEKHDYTTAVKLFQQVDTDRHAQFYLARIYDEGGYGVSKDPAAAVLWYRKAADQGSGAAQNNLGVAYKHGEGVTKDYAEAVKWYRKSAENGDDYGQVNLGEMYMSGLGVEENKVEAMKWYRLSAAQGQERAQYKLGEMYRSGDGTMQDYAQALEWFRKSADQDYSRAQEALARMYREGQGTKKDLVQAHKWLNINCTRHPDAASCSVRSELEKTMTSEQVLEAQKLARGWVPKAERPWWKLW